MDGALARLYRRMGAWYLALFVVFGAVSVAVLVTVVAVVACLRFLGLPVSVLMHVWRYGIVGAELAAALVIVATFLRAKPFVRWMGGHRDPEDAIPAWAAGVRMPGSLTWIAPIPIAAGVTPVVFMVYAVSRGPWYSTAAIVLGIALVIAVGITLNVVILETILRPVLLEIDETYPRAGLDARIGERSLRRRISRRRSSSCISARG